MISFFGLHEIIEAKLNRKRHLLEGWREKLTALGDAQPQGPLETPPVPETGRTGNKKVSRMMSPKGRMTPTGHDYTGHTTVDTAPQNQRDYELGLGAREPKEPEPSYINLVKYLQGGYEGTPYERKPDFLGAMILKKIPNLMKTTPVPGEEPSPRGREFSFRELVMALGLRDRDPMEIKQSLKNIATLPQAPPLTIGNKATFDGGNEQVYRILPQGPVSNPGEGEDALNPHGRKGFQTGYNPNFGGAPSIGTSMSTANMPQSLQVITKDYDNMKHIFQNGGALTQFRHYHNEIKNMLPHATQEVEALAATNPEAKAWMTHLEKIYDFMNDEKVLQKVFTIPAADTTGTAAKSRKTLAYNPANDPGVFNRQRQQFLAQQAALPPEERDSPPAREWRYY